MKLIFRNAELQGILEITKNANKFQIPYEGNKTQKNPTIWLVSDEGIYFMPSAINRPKDLHKAKMICYAEGHGENTHRGGDDFVEEIPFDDKLCEFIERGFDLVVNLNAKSMTIGATKRIKPTKRP